MRLIVLALILIGTVINLVQNQQPITLYFLGTDAKTAFFSLQLSLGIWITLFTLAGIISSLLIQFVSRSSRSFAPKRVRPPRSRKPEPPEIPYSRPDKPQKSDWETSPPPEWENNLQEEDDDEWDIEEPPVENTVPRQASTLEDTASEFEVQKPPKAVAQEGTVYSYTYKELSDRRPSQPPPEPPKSETEKKTPSPQRNRDVYDAQYRIITPPYRPSQQSNNEDEENEENWI
ncbi:MAG: LapA family protein [Crocosphaera sp.]